MDTKDIKFTCIYSEERLREPLEGYSDYVHRHRFLIEDIVEHPGACERLQEQYKEALKSEKFLIELFVYEMWNHEYAINHYSDYEVISAYKNKDLVGCRMDEYDLEKLFEIAKFSDLEKTAYRKAKKFYRKHSEM